MEKKYYSNQVTENEYTIRQAAAGNWCVDVQPYAGETSTYLCFSTESEAYAFILGWEHGINPVEFEEEEEL